MGEWDFSADSLQGVTPACELGWVDLNFQCSSVCRIMPGLMSIVAEAAGQNGGTP